MTDAPATNVDRNGLEMANAVLQKMQATLTECCEKDLSFADAYAVLRTKHLDQLVRDPDLLWNVYAQTYGALEHLRSYRALQDAVVDQLAMNDGVHHMVDLGCGPALLERRLACEGKLANTRVSCFELSDAMRAEAGQRTHDWQSAGVQISFTRHNLNETVPLQPASADRIVCTNVLGFLSPTRVASLFGEMRMALRPNGILVLTTQKPDFDLGAILCEQASAKYGAQWSLRQNPQNLLQMLEGAMRNTNQNAHDPLALNMLSNEALLQQNAGSAPYTPSAEELQKLAEGAGFAVDRCTSVYADQYHLLVARPAERQAMHDLLATNF